MGRPAIASFLLLSLAPATLAAQSTGRVVGFVEAEGEPVPGVRIVLEGTRLETLTTAAGRFVLTGIPPGTHDLRAERLGYRQFVLRNLEVRAGQATQVRIPLEPSAVAVEGVEVDARRTRLIEPEVTVSRTVTTGPQLRELPVDAVEEVVELTPGVYDGHFRGGRTGQEVYVVDGLELKNALEASRAGLGLELSPSSLQEVDVTTGGFGAEFGSALSGVVSYVTRRGDSDRWSGRAAFQTDHIAPQEVAPGFTSLSASAGGPLAPLGATLFLDVLAQGLLDSDPRARGLSCVRPGDAEPEVADRIRLLAAADAPTPLHCPYTGDRLPNQRGDRLIGFARLDRPIGARTSVMASFLGNRTQGLLYTPEFKYNPDYQLGQRTTGALAQLALEGSSHREGRALRLEARVAFARIDRHLGAVDLGLLEERGELAGIGLSGLEFVGEAFVRRPIAAQLAEGGAVPGHQRPRGSVGSPFGPAAEGLFFTEGTPDVAAWSRSDQLNAELGGELFTATGHGFRAGAGGGLQRVELYERVGAHLPGSTPNYARFFPRTARAWVEARLMAAEDVVVQLGIRAEAFRTGIRFLADRGDLLSPVLDASWRTQLLPRIAVAGPVPGTRGTTALRLSYGRVAQPPDYRFFLDATLGDSLRNEVRRQGNPNLGFERGSAWEVAVSQILGDAAGATLTLFRKELDNLVSGSGGLDAGQTGRFRGGDFGTVEGLEVAVRGRASWVEARLGYTLQRAIGVGSGLLDEPAPSPEDVREEFPLAFDRRHALSGAAFLGRATGVDGGVWGAVVSASGGSGYPLERTEADADDAVRLPWSMTVDARVFREFALPRGCERCRARVLLDARNLLGRENVLALRRASGRVAPTLGELQALADRPAFGGTTVPFHSPRYSPVADLDRDGLITQAEFREARFAAALDLADPSLLFGEPRQVRVGVEVTF